MDHAEHSIEPFIIHVVPITKVIQIVPSPPPPQPPPQPPPHPPPQLPPQLPPILPPIQGPVLNLTSLNVETTTESITKFIQIVPSPPPPQLLPQLPPILPPIQGPVLNLTSLNSETTTESTGLQTLLETTTTATIATTSGKLATVEALTTSSQTSLVPFTPPPVPPIDPFIVNNVPIVSTGNTSIIIGYKGCGEPGFCSSNIYTKCSNSTLSECQECDNGLAAVFMFFIVCLGIAILLGNLLIVLVGYRKQKERKKDKIDVCKSSLAIADIVTGIQLLTVVVYNFSWSIHSTPYQITNYSLTSPKSGWAFFGGTLLLFGFTSSVYHLLLMSLLRLLAVTFPLKYKFLKVQTIGWCLLVVWVISAIAATLPGWFPDQINFVYQIPLLLFYPAASSYNSASTALGMTAFFYLIPYLLMTLSTIITAIMVRQYQNKKRKLHSTRSTSNEYISKQEISVFITILIMQVAFTVAMIPNVIVISLFYNRDLTCSNITIPFVVAVYFSMVNSLVNVFIYNFRDKNFRATAKKILCFRASKQTVDLSKEKGSGNQHFPLSKQTESSGVVHSNGSHAQSVQN